MDNQSEVAEAAEALRSWVNSQRATWTSRPLPGAAVATPAPATPPEESTPPNVRAYAKTPDSGSIVFPRVPDRASAPSSFDRAPVAAPAAPFTANSPTSPEPESLPPASRAYMTGRPLAERTAETGLAGEPPALGAPAGAEQPTAAGSQPESSQYPLSRVSARTGAPPSPPSVVTTPESPATSLAREGGRPDQAPGADPAANAPAVETTRVASNLTATGRADAAGAVVAPSSEAEAPKRRRIDIGAFLAIAMKIAATLVVVGALAAGGLWGKDKWAEFANAPQLGTLTIGSSPTGAEVLVDGKPVGVTPLSLDLEAGAHDVELRLKGAKKTQTVDVARGQTLAVNVDWKARRYGSLSAASVPNGARVIVDGRERGRTPLVLDDLTVGAHSVVIESPEGSVRRRVVIGEGKTEALSESIFPGWLHVSAPIEVVVSDGGQSLQLDSQGRVLLKPGMHDIRIGNEALDFVLVRRIEIEPGDTTSIDLESPQSELTVNGPPGAAVFVDGDKVGETPLVRLKVKVGARDLKVVDRNGASYHMTVTVTTKPAEVNVDFSKRD